MEIHVSKDGQSMGPYSVEQVNQYIDANQFGRTEMNRLICCLLYLGLAVLLAIPSLGEGVSESEEKAYREASELMSRCRYEDARLAYGRFLGLWRADSPLAPQAAFERAQCLIMEDKTEEGVREMIALAQRYPQFEDTPLALWVAVNFFLTEKPDKSQAWFYAEQILKTYPDHPLAEHVKQYWPSIEKMTPAELAKQAKKLKALEKESRGRVKKTTP